MKGKANEEEIRRQKGLPFVCRAKEIAKEKLGWLLLFSDFYESPPFVSAIVGFIIPCELLVLICNSLTVSFIGFY